MTGLGRGKTVSCMSSRSLGLIVVAALATSPLSAQDINRTTAIDDLPRPGYEPRTIRTNGFVIMPMIETGIRFDNNILASDLNKRSDTIFLIEPSIEARRETGDSNLRTRAYASLSRYGKNSRENTSEFGAYLQYRKDVSQKQSVFTKLAYDRTFERRGDPEANFASARRPALIDMTSAELEYGHNGPRVGIVATLGVTKLNYLSVEDADRDMVTYRAAVKGSLHLSQRIVVFIQPFANRRVPRLNRDRFGVNRTTTTYGATTGVALQVADRLTGEVGVGLFHADPKDLNLRPFDGLAANGRVTWRPRTRTAVIFNLFRGDVATIRSGALGRIDSRFDLNIDQEARHNLILRGSLGVRNIHYRGGFDQDQRYFDVGVSARYLANRHMWIEPAANHSRRNSANASEDFHKWRVALKMGFIY